MKRIYISGPITGTDDYMERFAAAEKKLTERGNMVYNPAKICAGMPEGTIYEEYMTVALTLLNMADTIYMLEGWQESWGANREYGYAIEKGKAVIMETIKKVNPYAKAFDALDEFDLNAVRKGDRRDE